VRKTAELPCDVVLTVGNRRARLELDKSSGVDGHKASTAANSSSQIWTAAQLGKAPVTMVKVLIR
jgi:hypothetical protein